MRVFVSVIRTLVILLLTLRVVASPLAMRPDCTRHPKTYRLVARVCAWPVHPPVRAISAKSLVPRFPGKGTNNPQGQGHSFGIQNIVSVTCSVLSRLGSPVSSQHLPLQLLSVHLRC